MKIVGNFGFVDLVSVGPGEPGTNYDMVPVWAARASFLGETKDLAKDYKLLRYLIEHKHDGPFEMVQYHFRIKAPVVVWWQLVRHRNFSFNLQSGRYTEFAEEMEFPAAWRRQSKTNKQGSDGELSQGVQDELTLMFASAMQQGYANYRRALDLGCAREQARFFLPAWTSLYVGYVRADLRNLLHFLSLRTAPDAQMEIREYAEAMAEFVREYNPKTYEYFLEFNRL